MSTSLQELLQSSLGDAYRVERELAPGGMSRLFLATERSLERQVVVKLLPPELASEASAQRFQREMLVTAKLQHAHILPILSAGARDGLLYYVTPYIAGESLRQRLALHGALPIDATIHLLREVADALAFAHAFGVIHRDLKPENIFLQHGHAILADFGIARAVEQATEGGSERLTRTGTGLGTPGYMSPEQLAGES
ncbi:MAG TPA: serine/threonine-protein kinase, partial [Gemmatimonadaceae bacterium]